MPRACASCGLQNPDNARFCQNCGRPMAVAGPPQPVATGPAPTPTPGYPPPAPAGGQGGYYNPYLTPGTAPQPAHRTSMLSVIGVLIGVLGVACAVAILALHSSNRPIALPPAPTLTPLPPATATTAAGAATAASTQAPVATQAPNVPTQVPSATVQPADTAVPAGTQAPSTGGGQTFTAQTFSVQVPGDWTVSQQQTNAVVLAHHGSSSVDGVLYIFAGQASAATTAQAVLQQSLAGLQKQYADAKQCGAAAQISIGSLAGTAIPVCYTLTPQGGSAIQALTIMWATTNTAGTTVYVLEETGAQNPPDFFNNSVPPVVKTIQWTVS